MNDLIVPEEQTSCSSIDEEQTYAIKAYLRNMEIKIEENTGR
jgi:hypothetical protein